jgi:pyruvate dehydrogenase E2 component (dihydrolipoamide acetyltransferase)
LTEIALETRGFVERGRLGALTPRDLAPATFTISNLGMYGMTAITPVIDLPQAAILGVGAIRETLALERGEVVERRVMTLRLSCDHRILFGADAARFLSSTRDRLERPLLLLS